MFLQFFRLLSFSLTDYTTGVCLATKHLLITQSWASHSELDWICIGWDLDSQIWMRTSFLQMEAQEVSASWVSDCVQAYTTLWKGIKMKEVFLLSRGLSHTDSQPVSFHEFFMKPLMAMAFCTAANEKDDLLISPLVFCCDNVLTHLCTAAKSRFTPPSARQKPKRDFNCF